MGAGEPGRARQAAGRAPRSCPSRWRRKQLERTQFVDPRPGDAQRQTILAAGEALQSGGVIKPEVDVAATVDALLQPSFAAKISTAP